MKKIVFSCFIIVFVLSCTKSQDKSYEAITNDPLYLEYYKGFRDSANQALKTNHTKIAAELKACGMYNNETSSCDPLPDCNELSSETIQWINKSCQLYKASQAVKEKYNLTIDEFGKILSKYIEENYEVN